MNGAEAVIHIDGLVKHYGKVEAVRGIDLDGGTSPPGTGHSAATRWKMRLNSGAMWRSWGRR